MLKQQNETIKGRLWVLTVKEAPRSFRPGSKQINRYAGIADILPEEYYEYFYNVAERWTTEDLEYLCEWWGRTSTAELALAVGRPPWSLQRKISELRKRGVKIPYQRSDYIRGGVKNGGQIQPACSQPIDRG